MIKKKYLIFPLLMVGLLATGCSKSLPNVVDPEDTGIDTPWEEYNIPVESVIFPSEHENVAINVGGVHEYEFTYSPKNATVENLIWTSGNEEVAALSINARGNHIVTGVGVGVTTVTVSGGEEAKFNPVILNVRVDKPITSFDVTSSKDITLDYDSNSQIEVSYTPSDTTQIELIYSSSDESVVKVSQDGLISSLEKEGSAVITVKSPYISIERQINVSVVDQYKYLSKFEVVPSVNRIEVDKTFELDIDALPADHSADLNEVVYETSTPEILSIEGNVVTTLNEGEGKVYARVPQRGGDKLSPEVSIDVYEVKATELSLLADSKQVINLDNRDNSSHQLEYAFTTDEQGNPNPSRSEVKYSCDPEGVVLISEDGLVSTFDAGSTRVTITDLYSGKSDYADFVVTLRTKSVVISGSSLAYIDESITLKATVSPTNFLSPDITWNVTEGDESKLTLVEHLNTLTINSSVAGTYKLTASNDGITSEEFEIKFEERPVFFEMNHGYIVGSANYAEGISSSLSEGSWNNAKYAYEMHDKYDLKDDKDNVIGFGYKSTITFKVGDEWKIRMNVNDWKDIDSFDGEIQLGCYKIYEGAFIKGQMSVKTDDDGNRSIIIDKEGTYDIYYSEYTDTEYGWYEVYAEEHGLKVDVESLNIQLGHLGTAYVSGWEGPVTTVIEDESIATVDRTDGLITVFPVALGETTLVVSDGVKTINIPITVSDKSVDFEEGHYYLVGSADYSTGSSKEGESWNNPLKAFEFIDPVEDASLKAQYKGVIDFKSGEEFKIRNGSYYPNVYAEQAGAIPGLIYREAENYSENFRVKESGTYEVYVKIGFDDGMSIYISQVQGLTLSKDETTLQVGHSDIITATHVKGSLTVSSGDSSIATAVLGNNNQITITGVSEGQTTVTIRDDLYVLTVEVNVQNQVVLKDITIYLAGVETWDSITEVNFALDNSWKAATREGDGRFKYTFETDKEASTLNCFFTQNYGSQYRHPTSGNVDWNTDYSSINLGDVKLEPGNSYVITWTSWHYNWDNWEHAWFNYAFTRVSQ